MSSRGDGVRRLVEYCKSTTCYWRPSDRAASELLGSALIQQFRTQCVNATYTHSQGGCAAVLMAVAALVTGGAS